MRGLLGTGPLDPTLESASPPLLKCRFGIDSTSIRYRFPDLTLFRCQIDPRGWAVSRVGSRGTVPNKPLTIFFCVYFAGCFRGNTVELSMAEAGSKSFLGAHQWGIVFGKFQPDSCRRGQSEIPLLSGNCSLTLSTKKQSRQQKILQPCPHPPFREPPT